MPTLDNEWMDADTNEIGVRQHYVLMDALKEGHKKRFDPTKLLKVSSILEFFSSFPFFPPFSFSPLLNFSAAPWHFYFNCSNIAYHIFFIVSLATYRCTVKVQIFCSSLQIRQSNYCYCHGALSILLCLSNFSMLQYYIVIHCLTHLHIISL